MQQLQTEKLQPIELPSLPDNPLVSILVPNYNYANYISETIDSILCQTYPYFEVIICDDGSSDNSCEIITKYADKDSRIKLISKKNGGVATALNTAYWESKGQIICILDADDVWIDRKLEKVVEAFKCYPKNGFVIHNVIQIDGQGNLIKSEPLLKQLASGWMAVSALENGGFVYNIPPASALSLHRKVAEFIFPLNEEFKRNADSLIFRLAPFITEIGSVQEVLSKFRLHGANTTSQLSLTADFLERQQVVLESVHQEQQQFLEKIYGKETAKRLKDLHFSASICHDLYLLSRFKDTPKIERRKIYHQVVNHPQFSEWALHQKLLFRWGEYLPNPIFKMLFNQLYGSSRLKHFVKWLFKGGPLASHAE